MNPIITGRKDERSTTSDIPLISCPIETRKIRKRPLVRAM